MNGQGTKIYDIQQKFGTPSMEIEGAIRYLMNFLEDVQQEVFMCLAMKDSENLNKEILDGVKEVLQKVPIFVK